VIGLAVLPVLLGVAIGLEFMAMHRCRFGGYAADEIEARWT
jgi:hypothetical protein